MGKCLSCPPASGLLTFVCSVKLLKGLFSNYVDKIFFDHLPPCIDIFYGMNVDKKWTFLDLPTSSCKCSLWTAPNLVHLIHMSTMSANVILYSIYSCGKCGIERNFFDFHMKRLKLHKIFLKSYSNL